MKRECAVFLLLLLGLNANSAERYEFYNGTRELGMGGARIAVVNDETAMLINPAALGKLRDYFFTVADPEGEVNGEAQRIVGLDILAAADPQKLKDKAAEFPGRHFHQRVQVFPSFVLTNFGIGVFGKYSADGEVNAAGTQFRLDYRNDFALVLGYNLRIWDGRIKLGFNSRFVNRIEIAKDIATASTGVTVGNQASEGLGVGSDVGLILSAPWKLLPTLAGVWRDVGGTKYNVTNGLFQKTTERPATTAQTVDVALALFPILANQTRMSFSLEYRDILTASEETDMFRRTHGGIELNFRDAVFLRAGYHQRYWSAGMEFSMKNYQLQFASYGEEIGTKENPREDRRYNAKFSYRF